MRKTISTALFFVLICFSAVLSADLEVKPDQNMIKVGEQGSWRQTREGIAIYTSAKGFDAVSSIPDLDPGSGDNKISLKFKNADIRDLIRMIQKMSGFNIVVCKGVMGQIEQVQLTDVDWPVALASLAYSKGYAARIRNGIIFIGDAKKLEWMFSQSDNNAPTDGDLISISFKDTAIVDVLKVVTARTKRNIVIEKSTVGHLTVSLHDVSETAAVTALVRTNGFDCLYHDSVWFIGSPLLIETLRQQNLAKDVQFNGGDISMDFRDTDIRAIFNIIAKQSKMKLSVTDNVQGNITVKLTDMPSEKAASYIAWGNGYDIEFTTDGIQIK
ncbi:MAG: hypothetical protein KKB51_03845 [Candidatus Riflebacteria bacterium]|nr:hypothetical protein [Candidatus Riflebacteria bacterium]